MHGKLWQLWLCLPYPREIRNIFDNSYSFNGPLRSQRRTSQCRSQSNCPWICKSDKEANWLFEIINKWMAIIYWCKANSMKYQTSVSQAGKGRPHFLVPKEQLEFLHSVCFTWTEIAQLIEVSRMTIYRRWEEYGMLTEPVETSDSELRQKVLEVKRMLPQVGELIILGQLWSIGYKVTRWRVREALHSTDLVIKHNTKMARGSYSQKAVFCSRSKFIMAHWYVNVMIVNYCKVTC